MAQHNIVGKEGEQIACEYLIAQGLTIRETNWRMDRLEIDIVAHKPGDDTLHIVEVKTRTSDEYFDPMMAITPRTPKRRQPASLRCIARCSAVLAASPRLRRCVLRSASFGPSAPTR